MSAIDFEAAAVNLWGIMDDIDTTTDIMLDVR